LGAYALVNYFEIIINFKGAKLPPPSAKDPPLFAFQSSLQDENGRNNRLAFQYINPEIAAVDGGPNGGYQTASPIIH
jgi:hypothetical protein